MAFSPRTAAAWLRKWAEVGIRVDVVNSGLAALENDKRESVSRAPKDEGKLARTIRLVKPSSRSKDARAGTLVFRLGAGSRSRDRRKRVEYARVLQTGKVWGSSDDKTRSHLIGAREGDYDLKAAGLMGGPPGASKFKTTGRVKFKIAGKELFRRSVKHPGSVFKGSWYLRFNEQRFKATIDAGLQRSADRAGSQSSAYEGLGGS